MASPSGSSGGCRGHEPQLEALRRAAQGDERRREQLTKGRAYALARFDLVRVGDVLAREQHHPRRTIGRQRIGTAGLLARLANGVGPGQLQRQERHDALTGDPLTLVRRIRSEQDERAAATLLIGRGRDVHPQGDVGRPGEIARHGRGGIRSIGRDVQSQPVAMGPLDGDAATECRTDRRRQRIEPVAAQGEAGEVALQVLRLSVELRPLVDQEPDHAPFQGDRIDAIRTEHGQSDLHRRRRQRLEGTPATVTADEHDARDPGPGQRGHELLGPSRSFGDDGQGSAGDDREIARLQGVEGGNAGLQDADPADLPRRPVARQPRSAKDAGIRQQGFMELAERGHGPPTG